MAALWGPLRPLAVLANFQTEEEQEEEEDDEEEAVDVDVKKQELEAQLQQDLERLAEERKEGLHRIDWQLAEAVENLHAETVRRANDRISKHQQVLANLERKRQLSRSHSAHSQRSGADSEAESGEEARHGSGANSLAHSEDEAEEPGVWDSIVTFVKTSVEPSASSTLAAGLSWFGTASSSWSIAGNANRLRGPPAYQGAESQRRSFNHQGGGSSEMRKPLQKPLPSEVAGSRGQAAAPRATGRRQEASASTQSGTREPSENLHKNSGPARSRPNPPPPPPPAPSPFPEDDLQRPRGDLGGQGRPGQGPPHGSWQPPPSHGNGPRKRGQERQSSAGR